MHLERAKRKIVLLVLLQSNNNLLQTLQLYLPCLGIFHEPQRMKMFSVGTLWPAWIIGCEQEAAVLSGEVQKDIGRCIKTDDYMSWMQGSSWGPDTRACRILTQTSDSRDGERRAWLCLCVFVL